MTMMQALGLMALPLLLTIAPTQAQPVSQNEIGAFVAKVKTCWNVPPEAVGSSDKVRVSLELARDGSVVEARLIDSDLADSALGRSAIRALHLCAPYSFSTATYDKWKQIVINLQP